MELSVSPRGQLARAIYLGPRGVAAASRLQTAAGVVAVVVGVLASFLAIRLTGGSPNPWNHLGYAPIVLAAYLFGVRGSLPTALGVAFVLGPLPVLIGISGGTEDVTGPFEVPPSWWSAR